MKKGDIVEFKEPYPDEIDKYFVLVEDPDGGRVLGRELVNMVLPPCQVLGLEDIKISDKADEIRRVADILKEREKMKEEYRKAHPEIYKNS